MNESSIGMKTKCVAILLTAAVLCGSLFGVRGWPWQAL
jgi:hypothetical protein